MKRGGRNAERPSRRDRVCGSRQRGEPSSASRKENKVANFPSHLDQVLTLLHTYGRSQALTPSLRCPCGRLAVCREVILGAGRWDFCCQHVTTLSLLPLYPEGKRSPALGGSISCSSCPDDPVNPRTGMQAECQLDFRPQAGELSDWRNFSSPADFSPLLARRGRSGGCTS